MAERVAKVTALLIALTALLTAVEGFANKASSVSCGVWAGFPWCECGEFETIAACEKAQNILKKEGLL